MKQWYALRSKPKKESSAAALLSKADIEIYLPQTSVHKQHGKPPALEPFFPGYFFGRLDPHQGELRLARYTYGVLHILGYGNDPWPVPDEVVEVIQRRLARRQGRGDLIDFRPGERLVITSGPLRDVEAVFDRRLSPTGRVQVLIQLLERVCRAELDVSQLRRPGKAAGIAVA